jgi:hypothetical protein
MVATASGKLHGQSLRAFGRYSHALPGAFDAVRSDEVELASRDLDQLRVGRVTCRQDLDFDVSAHPTSCRGLCVNRGQRIVVRMSHKQVMRLLEPWTYDS